MALATEATTPAALAVLDRPKAVATPARGLGLDLGKSAVLPDGALAKAALAPRARAAQAAARFKATGELSDFLVATVIEAFLRLRADEAHLDECLDTILNHNVKFGLAFQYGWVRGVVEVLDETIEAYKRTFAELEEFLEDLGDAYVDYWSAITDLGTLTKIVLAIKDSGDRTFEETVLRLYDAVAGKHSDLAVIMLDVLDRLNRLSAILRIFEEKSSDEIVRGIVAELGQTLSGYWQSDIDRYLALRKRALSLGHEIGKDYGRLTAEVALLVVGV